MIGKALFCKLRQRDARRQDSHSHVTAAPLKQPSDWVVPLALVALCFAALLITYWPTAQSMFAIWRRSDTFAHGVLVAPLSAYLIW
ncbi:MAG: archaeosortase/exosortase family protein, partial [Burkholderiales bacterium]